MDEKNYEVMIECRSEKENVSLGFGFAITEEEYRKAVIFDSSNIGIGLSDSYHENYFEFEPGIEKAKQLFAIGQYSSLREAAFDVFGHFALRFEVDDAERDFSYEYDVDEGMYSLLDELLRWD